MTTEEIMKLADALALDIAIGRVDYAKISRAALLAAVEELAKDAERYREIKTGDYTVDYFVNHSYGWKVIKCAELDSHLDAAMKGQS